MRAYAITTATGQLLCHIRIPTCADVEFVRIAAGSIGLCGWVEPLGNGSWVVLDYETGRELLVARPTA